MSNILFVCETNCCVSQLAASYVQSRMKALGKLDEFELHCGGLHVRRGDAVPPECIEVMRSQGIQPIAYFPRQISLKDIRMADLIVCMTEACAKKLTSSFRSADGKVIQLMGLVGRKEDVFEPRRSPEPMKNCLAMMTPALDRLVERLV